MSIIYRKSLKGTEEIALRSYGLSLRMRPYLLIVDGAKSTADLAHENPAIPEIEMVLKSLLDAGFIELVATQPSQGRITNANVVEMQRVSNGASQPSSSLRSAMPDPIVEAPLNLPGSPKSPKLDYLKSQMVQEISGLLGRDAGLVASKIQNCQSTDDLFATLMGLKKIINMYAGAEQADAFVRKFSGLATM